MTKSGIMSLRITAELDEDLAVLRTEGVSASQAIRMAVRLMADGYRTAWDYDVVPRNTPPQIDGVRLPGFNSPRVRRARGRKREVIRNAA